MSLLQCEHNLYMTQAMGAKKIVQDTAIKYGHHFDVSRYFDEQKSNSKMDIVIWPAFSEYMI